MTSVACQCTNLPITRPQSYCIGVIDARCDVASDLTPTTSPLLGFVIADAATMLCRTVGGKGVGTVGLVLSRLEAALDADKELVVRCSVADAPACPQYQCQPGLTAQKRNMTINMS